MWVLHHFIKRESNAARRPSKRGKTRQANIDARLDQQGRGGVTDSLNRIQILADPERRVAPVRAQLCGSERSTAFQCSVASADILFLIEEHGVRTDVLRTPVRHLYRGGSEIECHHAEEQDPHQKQRKVAAYFR
jgi:hypothetical protein